MLLVEHRPKLGTVVFEQEIFTDGAGNEGRPGEIGLADIIVNELDQPGRDKDMVNMPVANPELMLLEFDVSHDRFLSVIKARALCSRCQELYAQLDKQEQIVHKSIMEKKKKCQIDELTFAFLDSKLPPEDQKSERRKQLFIAPSFPPNPRHNWEPSPSVIVRLSIHSTPDLFF
jgi:hypothetical protein